MKLTAKQIHILQTMRRARAIWNAGLYKVVHVYSEQAPEFKPGGKQVVARELQTLKKLGLVKLVESFKEWGLTDAGNKFLDEQETSQ